MSEHNITVEGGTSVRLLTAGKYCDRNILVTAEGGGIALDVITASTPPATVTDGQIVVITDTTPGTVYIDTDAPANPASGDVWVKLEAGADIALELTEESPYLRSGMTEATVWDGNQWNKCDGYLGKRGSWEQFAYSFPAVGTPLNDFTWEQIAMLASSGKASQYFKIGDAKAITINGKIGNTNFSNIEAWAFIIGFDHNSGIEGNNTIHFQICKSAQTNGVNLCLTDSQYQVTTSSGGYFNMTTSSTNSGGWKTNNMRNTILGNNGTPTAPTANTMLAAMPEDLRAVMKGCTKYTDNSGGGSNTASKVSATTDYLWLLAEYEVFGARHYGNSAESGYQKQYAYYASGNPNIFYQYSSPTTPMGWWLRSVNATASDTYLFVYTENAPRPGSGRTVFGINPAFCV